MKIFVSLFLIINISCHQISGTDIDKSLIKKAIFSKEFMDHFRICEIDKKQINIYDDIKNSLQLTFQDKIECGKIITFSKINFDYNVNTIEGRKKGIVLYNFEKNNTFNTLSFLSLENNYTLKMKYNRNLRLVNISEGSF